MLRVCDLALRSAADSGTKVTQEANSRFEEAIQVLSSHSERRHHLDPLNVYSKMEIAKWKDSVQREWSHEKSEDEWGRTMIVDFVLLQSPLLSPRDPETVIVTREHRFIAGLAFDNKLDHSEVLSADPSFSEILWNFSRYKGRARITLEQNPHFYLRCPADESVYTPGFRRRPLQDPSGALEHNGTIYVLFDRPGRVFLTADHKPRIFGNVWSLNGSLIFRDRSGVLEGEQLVRNFSMRYELWYCEEPVVHQDSEARSRSNHSYLRPIVMTPLANHSVVWKVLSLPASHCIDIHIHGSRGSTSSLDPTPPLPTSEQPGYDGVYVTIDGLNDDILLVIFDYYRLDGENAWNVRLGWCKLFHVCQIWRYLIRESIPHLGLHILCTNGTPTVDTLDHLPPLPLFIDYRYTDVTISEQDELALSQALRLRNRVRRIDLHLPSSILRKFLMLMEAPFPILGHLSLSFTADKTTTLALSKTFRAPNLRHLTLLGICLPKRLRPLSSTSSLVTLSLTNIRAFGYIRPRLLVARLQSLPQLEEFIISFSVPIPRPSAERELLGNQGTPVTLPNLKTLRFQGVNAYLERLVAQIRAPLLERLNITLFNQIAFALPYLSHFTNRTEGFKFRVAEVSFGRDMVSVITDNNTQQHNGRLSFHVMCRQLDWQIDCAAQICSALMPALSGVERLKLQFYDRTMPTEWQNGEIDSTTWHELFRAFIGVRELHICAALSQELSRALQVDEARSDQGLLPGLRELVSEFKWERTDNPFGSFIDARRAAGRPVPTLTPILESPNPPDAPNLPVAAQTTPSDPFHN
ncbi:hypothetical protein EDB89DRAFT_885835 [Lactarius sanguifluus]|nr:hypothetical protein EDB89DRAFT_885835 [Lactarius sanguifluus]